MNRTTPTEIDSPARKSCDFRSHAFTLIELLVVIAIIGVMSVALVPALKGTLDGINLSGAGETIAGQLSVARQTAISRNLPVEVRIYQYNNNNNGLAYCVLALVIPSSVSGSAKDEWIIPGKVMAGNIIIDQGTSGSGDPFSTILVTGSNAAPSASNVNPPGPWTATESATAPSILKNLNYVAFRYQPDGSTDLPAGTSMSPQPWCISLKNSHSPATSGNITPAANFVSLVIDPLSGRTLTYRP